MNTTQGQAAQAAVVALVEKFGKEEVIAAADSLLGATVTRRPPSEYAGVLAPRLLSDTVQQLDLATEDIIRLGDAREAAYAEKGDLLRQKSQLSTQIDLKEAGAFMGAAPDGKSVTYEGKTHATSNDTLRDAFRRFVTKELREQLAEVEGNLQKVEIGIIQARDAYEKAVQASENVRSKAFVQGRLLQFLAGGI